MSACSNPKENTTMEYRIVWTVDIDADSHESAEWGFDVAQGQAPVKVWVSHD